MRSLGLILVIGLLALGLGAVAAMVVLPDPRPTPGTPAGYPHEQLEADRLMTEQMGAYVGPGMDAVMPAPGMLMRSRSTAYLRALEWHQYEVDRMLGRTP